MATCVSEILLNAAMVRSSASRGVDAEEEEWCGGALAVVVRRRRLVVNRLGRDDDCLRRRGLKDIGKGVMALDGSWADARSLFGGASGRGGGGIAKETSQIGRAHV